MMCTQRPVNLATAIIQAAMSFKRVAAVLLAGFLVSSVVGWGQTQNPSIPASMQGTGGAATNIESAASSMTDVPIFPGEIVHIDVFGAPDFSIVTRVSENGDVAYPMIGVVHLAGLSSVTAADLISTQLRARQLMQDPNVTVTVDSTSTGITVLGEVHSPGIYPPPGNHLLSDLLAEAGGLTANTGRVIEISNDLTPGREIYLAWDPTMHNTSNFDRPVHAGDRVLVRACGFAYVAGNVTKPGAYALCGSEKITLSEVLAEAGDIIPFIKGKHTLLIHTQPDGARVIQEVDVKKIQRAEEVDPIVREDDIVYVTPSPLKNALNRALTAAIGLSGTVIYVYHP